MARRERKSGLGRSLGDFIKVRGKWASYCSRLSQDHVGSSSRSPLLWVHSEHQEGAQGHLVSRVFTEMGAQGVACRWCWRRGEGSDIIVEWAGCAVVKASSAGEGGQGWASAGALLRGQLGPLRQGGGPSRSPKGFGAQRRGKNKFMVGTIWATK